MKVKFYSRQPGEPLVGETDWRIVPRIGDSVTLDGERVHDVHSVLFNYKTECVTVMLKP